MTLKKLWAVALAAALLVLLVGVCLVRVVFFDSV